MKKIKSKILVKKKKFKLPKSIESSNDTHSSL